MRNFQEQAAMASTVRQGLVACGFEILDVAGDGGMPLLPTNMVCKLGGAEFTVFFPPARAQL
jgi:hypothetical protein